MEKVDKTNEIITGITSAYVQTSGQVNLKPGIPNIKQPYNTVQELLLTSL